MEAVTSRLARQGADATVPQTMEDGRADQRKLRTGPRALLRIRLFAVALLLIPRWSRSEETRPSKVSPQATYSADLAQVIGGQEPGLTFLDNLDLTLRVHLEPLLGWEGGELFLYALGNQGGSISQRIGDVQAADNVEAPTNFSVLELWYEQQILRSSASVLFGLYDINSEFDHLHSANLFIGSSFGLNAILGASGRNGPSSFPVTSLAGRFKALVLPELYVQAAVVDGVPGDPERPRGTHIKWSKDEGILLLTETGILLGSREPTASDHTRAHARRRRAGREDVGLYRFKFASGNFWYSASYEDQRAGLGASRSNFGGYFSTDALLLRESPDTAEGLSTHSRLAYGNPRFNAMHLNWSGGLSYRGLIPDRPDDESGIGTSIVWAGRPHRQAARDSGKTTPTFEAAWEATHLFSLNEWFSIQLDVQWIENPGMRASQRDALLLLSRFQGAF